MVSNKHISQKGIICQERIRQARWGFNLAVGFVATSSAITLFGFFLFLTGQTSKGAYIAAGGLSSTAVGGRCMQLSRDANDRLDKLARERKHQSNNPNDDVEDTENDDVEDTENQCFRADFSPDGDYLTDALEKLEHDILLSVRRER